MRQLAPVRDSDRLDVATNQIRATTPRPPPPRQLRPPATALPLSVGRPFAFAWNESSDTAVCVANQLHSSRESQQLFVQNGSYLLRSGSHLTTAGEPLHAPVCAGMEDARAGAKPRLSHRDLRGRPRDPVPEGQSRTGLATPARAHGQAEADGQRGEDTNLQGAGGRVQLPGLRVRADAFGENRKSLPWLPASEEEHQAHGGNHP